ncbi:hypothetical protein METBIDRAFT_35621 [Metschnikowia bicuspidata var. bicuspidata NRRL YB-4993]|uniref:NADH dehydrogenase (Ubiquinone) complex I, assembly factor 6 n=1 Tax=Metschnikowia bicuspidata var. bicuspidata NRRL YB-4993 TaxID=869754 RepID=A0A1A0HIF9_9ASCO|nr:hypothetical protein METBIDRAFT_35621 [Metschnikowia bicuspidata var. bicuspidata NRRL YB-4993]OBA23954.1 hypothetical protein METBIDRAFT_35621 [Metschnikowia bicuspidata var. bicuspidata NRRL YB-4993]
MLRGPNRVPYAVRYIVHSARTASYQLQLEKSVENIYALLEANDRLSYLLAQYIPEPARNAFIAIRAFALEINKITDGGSMDGRAAKALNQLSKSTGMTTADMKFKFWSELLVKSFSDKDDIGEPVAFLLRDALRNGLNLDIVYFHQFLQTRRHFLKSQQFSTVSDICSYGEGTYSQLNYATQSILLSPQISPSVIHMLELSTTLQSKVSDIAAHIGQATAVSSMILGMNFYASTRNQVTLPVNIMTKHELSQEALLRLSQGHTKNEGEIKDTRDRLKNVIFETAITANDHLLSARQKLKQVKEDIAEILEQRPRDTLLITNSKNWRKGLPDVIFVPFMLAIPTSLYLQRLEKHDFDVYSKKLQHKEWRLAWNSFRNYYQRRI